MAGSSSPRGPLARSTEDNRMASPSAAELSTVTLFAGLDEAEREVVSRWLDVEEAEAGRRLTHQGAAGYSFFVLQEGAAEVLVDDIAVRTLGPGDYFGEIAMFESGRQT